MLSLFSDGFSKDLALVIVVTVAVGSILAYGAALAVDSYFGDTVTGLIGEFGQYDVIVHVREEARKAALGELRRVMDERIPGARLKEGLTIAGRANFFVSIPEPFKTRETFESLPSILSNISGGNGYTLIVEPSIAVRNVHRGVRNDLAKEMGLLPGVRFAFRDGSSTVAVLSSADRSQEVADAAKRLLGRYTIVQARFPLGYDAEDPVRMGNEMVASLRERYPGALLSNVTASDQSPEMESFIKALLEMRRFLLSYASKVTISLGSQDLLPMVGDEFVLQGSSPKPLGSGQVTMVENVVVQAIEVKPGVVRGMIVQGDVSQLGETSTQDAYWLVDSGQAGGRVGRATIQNERYRLSRTIQDSVKLLEQLGGLTRDADQAVNNASATLRTFQDALIQLEGLRQQIRQLQGLASEGSGTQQVLVSLVLSALFKSMGGSEGRPSFESLGDLDVKAMQDSVESIAARVHAVQTIDFKEIVGQITRVRETLPNLRDDEIGRSVRLIDRYIEGQVIPGTSIELLVGPSVDVKSVEKQVKHLVGNDYVSVFSMPAGVVNPDARVILFQVLKQVRQTIAGMLAVVFTLLVLALDFSTVMSVMRHMVRRSRLREGFPGLLADPVKAFGFGLGAFLLTAIYKASGGAIPLVNTAHIALLGGILGLSSAVLSERLSPVDSEEILAGEALGLRYVHIMREIVIPSARPGLTQILNRRKMANYARSV
ncbi:MAG: hypothetical protein HYY08_00130 [Firmicutes bacterium]|nr:hypothetical protein [Bacillota bacterium]